MMLYSVKETRRSTARPIGATSERKLIAVDNDLNNIIQSFFALCLFLLPHPIFLLGCSLSFFELRQPSFYELKI